MPKSTDKAYPKNWPQISARIRKRANHRCEECGLAEGAPINYRTQRVISEATYNKKVRVAEKRRKRNRHARRNSISKLGLRVTMMTDIGRRATSIPSKRDPCHRESTLTLALLAWFFRFTIKIATRRTIANLTWCVYACVVIARNMAVPTNRTDFIWRNPTNRWTRAAEACFVR
jgi:hypothetical protein